MSKDGILIRKIKNFNINSNNYNNNMIISPQLSVMIPMDELRDKLKNKHIKINIRKKSTNQIRKKNLILILMNQKIKIKKKLLIILKKIMIKMR